jgi:hypothetical protein
MSNFEACCLRKKEMVGDHALYIMRKSTVLDNSGVLKEEHAGFYIGEIFAARLLSLSLRHILTNYYYC